VMFLEPERLELSSVWIGHIPFAMLLAELLEPRTFVELGTHWGESYCAVCQAVAALNLPTKCAAVDTWKGDAHASFYGEEVWNSIRTHHDARLRWQGDPPSVDRMLSLEAWIGPARTEQNDFVGKVKSLVPKYDVAPNTGDSAKALAPHVDGTQDVRTPAVLAFQYDLSATWGAESTFIDMAAVLGALSAEELERIVLSLARQSCATCTKTKGPWSKTFNGPIIRAEYGGASVSIRLREDNLLRVVADCEPEFMRLKEIVGAWSTANSLRFTPQEGDLVIFDNWRLLHGRAAIGGRHQRIHDRMWIDRLLPEHEGEYLLGIRPLTPGLMDAVQRANGD